MPSRPAQVLVIVEAMKMENEIRAHVAGRRRASSRSRSAIPCAAASRCCASRSSEHAGHPHAAPAAARVAPRGSRAVRRAQRRSARDGALPGDAAATRRATRSRAAPSGTSSATASGRGPSRCRGRAVHRLRRPRRPGLRGALHALRRDRLAARGRALGTGLRDRGGARERRPRASTSLGAEQLVSFTTPANVRSQARHASASA